MTVFVNLFDLIGLGIFLIILLVYFISEYRYKQRQRRRDEGRDN